MPEPLESAPPIARLQRFPVALLLLCALAIAACATENPGIDPERAQFYFPTGLDLDPMRQVLYVSNSNADLRFNGGTLMAVDLRPLPADLSQIPQAVGAGTLDCAPSPLDPGRWECPEAQFVHADGTVRIGDFPGDVRVDASGTRLFVPIRGQTALVWAEVVELDDGRIDLRCDNDPEQGCGGVDTAGDCAVWDCDAEHRVNFSERLQAALPAEPFGIYYHRLAAVHRGPAGERQTCLDGASGVSCDCEGAADCTERPPWDHVYVAHLQGGEVSYFVSRPCSVVPGSKRCIGGGVELVDIASGFFNTETEFRGGFALAPSVLGDPGSPIFVSSRVDSALGSFVIDRGEAAAGSQPGRIVRSRRVSLAAAASPGDDVRGIAFGPGGEVLYALDLAPPTLVALDMTPREGRPADQPLWAVEVCSDPSVLRLGFDPWRPDDPAAQMAYVVCFSSAQILLVDTTTARIAAWVASGEGPNTLAFDRDNRRAFVANFADGTIGVIDLDPAHDGFLKMVLQIGIPERLVLQ